MARVNFSEVSDEEAYCYYLSSIVNRRVQPATLSYHVSEPVSGAVPLVLMQKIANYTMVHRAIASQNGCRQTK
jgi:hypothetical protein